MTTEAAAIAELTRVLRPDSTIIYLHRRDAPSGLSRTAEILLIDHDGDHPFLRPLSRLIYEAGIEEWCGRTHALRIAGSGMDPAESVLHDLAWVLWGSRHQFRVERL